MARLAEPIMTEELSKVAGEDVPKKFEVEIGKGRNADLVVFGDRINVFLESSEKPVAVLRFGGPHSGALWLHGTLVGEFIKEHPTGVFVVVEIEDGFKKLTPIEDKDPIRYLLERL